MPTALTIGPYRFFFYACDRDEPRHVHVERDDNIAKFWFEPVRMQFGGGFRAPEITRIMKHVQENREVLVEAWDEYFGS